MGRNVADARSAGVLGSNAKSLMTSVKMSSIIEIVPVIDSRAGIHINQDLKLEGVEGLSI